MALRPNANAVPARGVYGWNRGTQQNYVIEVTTSGCVATYPCNGYVWPISGAVSVDLSGLENISRSGLQGIWVRLDTKIRQEASGFGNLLSAVSGFGWGISAPPAGSHVSGLYYGYDNSGHIISGIYRDGGVELFRLKYTYDVSGNLTSVVRT